MADGTPSGETSTPETPKNGTQPPAPTQGNAGTSVDVGELEKLRKERDQAQMRANQLQKEKEAKDKAAADAEAKKLEEQNQFKDLYEQEKAKREGLEGSLEAEKAAKKLKDAKATVLADYPDELKSLAEDAGIEPASADEVDMNAFKAKLDKLHNAVGAKGKVGPNNPGNPGSTNQPSGDELKSALKDQNKFEEILSKRPGIAAMMTPKR